MLSGNNSSFLGRVTTPLRREQTVQYTAQFGNGVSATIGLDDRPCSTAPLYTTWRRRSTPGSGCGRRSVRLPRCARHAEQRLRRRACAGRRGNIRVDPAWGLFQISAAAHEVSGSYNSLGISGVPTGLAGPNPFGPSGAVWPPRHQVGADR